ncbi:ABC transporter substrate-binding protein [Streptomyces sp. N35]|uniref:ABC transporter substrate-binding protein n=1 Tax=Streptomyces sp. N35 TaxID=2795730 RepID=UPI0018F66166|nr:ABC transporter substrate-binding protein [Streptomyces sp. N35]
MSNHAPQQAMTRRGVLAGLGALGLSSAFGLTACSTSTPGNAAGSGASEADTIKLYGNALGEDAQKAAWQAVVAGWEKKSGKKVKPVIFPYDQAATQLALAAKSGSFNGVAQGPWQLLVPMGILADLSDLAEGMEIPRAVVDGLRVDGKLYMLPLTASGIGLVCDGRIADEVGLKSGLTVEEFATALEKIKRQDPDLIPYAAVTKNPDLKDAVHWMWGWGSEVVTKDLKCTIGDAESVAAIEWYKELQDAKLTKAGVARTDARIMFARGQAVMYDDAPLANTFVKSNGGPAALHAAIRPLQRPTAKGLPSYNRFWGSGLACSAGKGEKTSRDFISYVATDLGAATALYKQSALPPADKKVADRIEALQKDTFQTGFAGAVAEHARLSAWDTLSTTARIDTAIGEGVASILAGQVGVQSGLNDLRKKVETALEQG